MANAPEQAVKALNHLIETCKDGENGFRTAAGGVKRPDLKQLFGSYANQRGLFASELQGEVQRLGGKPETGGSVSAAVHRGWINIKSLVTGQDEAAIIAECEQGEDVALKVYEEALQADLPADIDVVVRRQLAQVREAHDRVRTLKVATDG